MSYRVGAEDVPHGLEEMGPIYAWGGGVLRDPPSDPNARNDHNQRESELDRIAEKHDLPLISDAAIKHRERQRDRQREERGGGSPWDQRDHEY